MWSIAKRYHSIYNNSTLLENIKIVKCIIFDTPVSYHESLISKTKNYTKYI